MNKNKTIKSHIIIVQGWINGRCDTNMGLQIGCINIGKFYCFPGPPISFCTNVVKNKTKNLTVTYKKINILKKKKKKNLKYQRSLGRNINRSTAKMNQLRNHHQSSTTTNLSARISGRNVTRAIQAECVVPTVTVCQCEPVSPRTANSASFPQPYSASPR